MIFSEIDAAGWALIVTAATTGIGSIILQALQMYFSYKRDTAIKKDTSEVVKATNGVTERIVTAELTAERLVTKAEISATALISAAAKTATNLAARPLVEPYTRQPPT